MIPIPALMGLLPIPSPRGSVHSQSEAVEKWSGFLGKLWLHKKKSTQHVKITDLRKLWEEAPNQIASNFIANHKSRESIPEHSMIFCLAHKCHKLLPPVPRAEKPVSRKVIYACHQYLTKALWKKTCPWKILYLEELKLE